MDFHPFSSEYPLMPERELGRMIQGMVEHGFDPRFPIVLFERMILDGRNRWIASREADVKPTFVNFTGTQEQARWFVQAANEERRHLGVEWLQRRREERRDRAAAARQQGKSLRTIAEEEGVSESQIRRDLEEAKSTAPPGAVEPPEGKVTGKDGRTRTATPKKPTESPEKSSTAPPGAVEPPTPPEESKSTAPPGAVEPPEGKVTGKDGRTRTATPKKPTESPEKSSTAPPAQLSRLPHPKNPNQLYRGVQLIRRKEK